MKCILLFPMLIACTQETKTDSGESQPDSSTEEDGEFSLLSSSFEDGGDIPAIHVCGSYGGGNVSPELHWENPPEASSFAIVMDDEVSPCGTGDGACRHWGVFNIPGDRSSMAEGQSVGDIGGTVEGLNYSGASGYAGPCPPNAHIYKITLYALGSSMQVIEEEASFTRSQFEAEHSSDILDQRTIQGNFDPDQ